MSRTYKATGINLKSMPLGEADRLVTVLTREHGLIRAVAPGARKHNSSLSGRSGLFVVNELLIAQGKSLDKITQAETIETYPRLSRDLGKLAASQYMAEIVIHQALSEQPQEELFCLLNEHLSRLDELPNNSEFLVLANLSHAVFHLLALGGIAPQVQNCCLTQQAISPDLTNPDWQVGFSIPAGGTVSLSAWEKSKAENRAVAMQNAIAPTERVAETPSYYQTYPRSLPQITTRFNATELTLLQQLAAAEISQIEQGDRTWLAIEQILRQYVEYHIDRPIRSAALIDSYFAFLPPSAPKQ